MIAPRTLLLCASASTTTTTTTMKPMTTQSKGNSSRRSTAFESAVEAVLLAAAAARTFVTNAFERLVSSISQLLKPSHTHTTACDKATAASAPSPSTAALSGNPTPNRSVSATSNTSAASFRANPSASTHASIRARFSATTASASLSSIAVTATTSNAISSANSLAMSTTPTSTLTSASAPTPTPRPTPTPTPFPTHAATALASPPQSLQTRPWSGGPVDERLYVSDMPSMVFPLPDREYNERINQRLAQRFGLTRVQVLYRSLHEIEHPLIAADNMRRAAARHVPHEDPPMYACSCSYCPDGTAAYMLCAAATIRRTMRRLGSRATTSVVGVTARRQSLIACHARSTSYPRFAR